MERKGHFLSYSSLLSRLSCVGSDKGRNGVEEWRDKGMTKIGRSVAEGKITREEERNDGLPFPSCFLAPFGRGFRGSNKVKEITIK